VAALVCLTAAAPARAQTAGYGHGDLRPVSQAFPVPGRELEPADAIAVARADRRVADELRRHRDVSTETFVGGADEWWVAFRAGGHEVAGVQISDERARVVEAWTGVQAEWPMARGYPGQFGRQAASLPVWLALLALFLAPFLRPPWRLLHLDLLALAGVSVSFALFSDGHVAWSVPLAYPPLVYLLGRMLSLARDRRPPQPLRIWGAEWLLAGIAFLVAARVTLQFASSNVTDVGYAGVVGADHLSHLRDVYGSFPADNPRGDTYGPLLYLAYVPFELIWPWHGTWDELPAAHVAAAAFDLACALGLFLAGGRGTRGTLLAYLWLAFPFTLLTANSGANDALVGAVVLGAVAWRSGALAAAAGLTKLAPLVLLPLLVRTRRSAAAAAVVLAGGAGLILLTDGGLAGFVDRAVRFQLERDSPFSVWGLYDLGALHAVATVVAAGFAVAAARVRDADRFALAAAVLLAAQLTAGHWFYTYLVWVLPLLLVALLRPFTPGAGSPRSTPPAGARARSAPAPR
jgi:hypothetical protein